MQIIEKNILTVEEGFILHQVNCLGVMGMLAGDIKAKWPIVFKEYKQFCDTVEHNWMLLGQYSSTNVEKNLCVVNVFGQLNIGMKDGRQTDYGALLTAFKKLEDDGFDDEKCYFPYKFGCGVGGGDWKTVSDMIEHYFPHAIICKI